MSLRQGWINPYLFAVSTGIYPPVPMTTIGTNTVSLQAYGNGAYVVSESSEFSSTYSGYYLFQSGVANRWAVLQTLGYPLTIQGAYTGATSNTVSGTSYKGEWMQIKMPNPIVPTSYNISYYSASFQVDAPYTWVFAGSNDGSTWVLLDNKSAGYPYGTSWSSTSPYWFTGSGTGGSTGIAISTGGTAYSYFKIIITGAASNMSFGKWAINGHP